MKFISKYQTYILITIALLFSFAIRSIWIFQFSDIDYYKHNNQFIINTNDGYYFAEGARDIISGSHQDNDLSPIHESMSKLTALLYKISPFSFETIIFYMSAFFSSLIVIPLILLGKRFDKIYAGFIAALLASIAWSYYNRTMVGYYDTDMLNIVFPTFLIWSIILALKSKEEKYILFTALEMLAYRWWYSPSYSLEFGFLIMVTIYVIYIIIKKKDYQYELKLIFSMLLAMMYIDILYRLAGIIALYFIYKKNVSQKILYTIFAVIVALFVTSGGLNPIFGQLKVYVFRDSVNTTLSSLNLHFYTVIQTVKEANSIPFNMFADRVSGNLLVFLLSFIGYIYLLIKHPIFFISIPLFGLGFISYGIPGVVNSGGLRFSIYAVSVFAFAYGFLVISLSEKIKKVFLKNTVIVILTLIALTPNILHILEYKIPPVFNSIEVKSLEKLKSVSSREDYVVGWWDYGYPIRYYADIKTLIDGGKHSGDVNFPVSFVLTSPQDEASKMARLDVEYTEKRFKDINRTMAKSNIEQMTLNYGFKDTNDFISSLPLDMKLPEKTRDIYLFLPQRMLSIYSTISLFSNLDLMTGNKKEKSFFFTSADFSDTDNKIIFGDNFYINKANATVVVNNNPISINNFIITSYKNQKLVKQKQVFNPNAQLNVIFIQNTNTFIILDDKSFNSLYVKLYVLEEYDEKLFEPVELNSLVKIYKLKI